MLLLLLWVRSKGGCGKSVGTGDPAAGSDPESSGSITDDREDARESIWRRLRYDAVCGDTISSTGPHMYNVIWNRTDGRGGGDGENALSRDYNI